VAALLSLYAAYVVVVAVADFSKRLGVEWGEVARTVHRRVSGRWRMEMVSPLLQEVYGAGGLAAAAGPLDEAQPLIRSPSPPAPPPLSLGSLATVPAERGGSLPAGLGAAAALGRGSHLSSPSPAPIESGGRVTSLPQLNQPERGQQWLERRCRWVGGCVHKLLLESTCLPARPPSYGFALPCWARPPACPPAPLPVCRLVPPVATFQPHVAYGDLVQMSAQEYRQRALADMAQVRGPGGGVSSCRLPG
jgi:hypothetical protein